MQISTHVTLPMAVLGRCSHWPGCLKGSQDTETRFFSKSAAYKLGRKALNLGRWSLCPRAAPCLPLWKKIHRTRLLARGAEDRGVPMHKGLSGEELALGNHPRCLSLNILFIKRPIQQGPLCFIMSLNCHHGKQNWLSLNFLQLGNSTVSRGS